MKKCVFLLVLFCSFNHLLHAQTPDPNYIKDAYIKGFASKNKDSLYYQRLFFNAFPSNFKSFEQLFGWNAQTNTGQPLTYVPKSFFYNLLHSKAYSRHEMLKKVISSSVNGDHNAGAAPRFGAECFKYALEHNDAFLGELKTFSKKDIVSVWMFYFDYPNIEMRKNNYNKMVAVTQKNNADMVPLITAGYQKARAKWAILLKR